MKKLFTIILMLILFNKVQGQDSLSILFLGNSLTYYNDLPGKFKELALSAGKKIYVESYCPGGYTLGWHASDAISISKIKKGNWDYVVLQEQGSIPLIPWWRYNDMYPNAIYLDSLIRANCGTPVFYIPAGVNTYPCYAADPNDEYLSAEMFNFNQWMDTTTMGHKLIADHLYMPLVPAGNAWKSILPVTTAGMFDSDNEHPGDKGQYLNACVFFAALFNTKSEGATYRYTLTQAQALLFQKTADSIVLNTPEKWNLQYMKVPKADFLYIKNSVNEIQFTSAVPDNENVIYDWDFGDGNHSHIPSPLHTYLSSDSFNVKLMLIRNCKSSGISKKIWIEPVSTTGIQDLLASRYKIYPNPVNDIINIQTNEKISLINLVDMFGNVIAMQDNQLVYTNDLYTVYNPYLNNGIYHLKINTLSGKSASFKISVIK